MRLIDADAYEFPGDLTDEPTIKAVPLSIIELHRKMWAAKAKVGHLSDRMRYGAMVDAINSIIEFSDFANMCADCLEERSENRDRTNAGY